MSFEWGELWFFPKGEKSLLDGNIFEINQKLSKGKNYDPCSCEWGELLLMENPHKRETLWE